MVPHIVTWAMVSVMVTWSATATADGYVPTPDEPRYRAQGAYTTHTPDLVVPGRFHAGPCIGSARDRAERGADYVPGEDAYGDPVVSADLHPHHAFHWSGPSFQYLFQRTPTAREAQLGLEPRDYVVVDARDGAVYYNDYRLSQARDVTPAPGLCD